MNGSTGLISSGNKRLYLLLDLLLITVLFVQAVSFIGTGEEDAYINYRYALNLVRGNGLVYNIGERVEGFSNPSWTILLALFNFFGFPVRFAAFFMAVLFDMLIFLCVRKIAVSIFPNPLLARIPLLMIALFTPMHASFGNGLEGSLWGLSLVLCVMGVAHKNKNAAIAGALLCLMTRPEGFVIYCISLLYVYKGCRFNVKNEYKHWNAYIGVIILMGLPVLLCGLRYIYYNDFLPNTLWAKSMTGAVMNKVTFAYLFEKGFEYYLQYGKAIGIINLCLLILSIFFFKKELVFYSLLLIALNILMVLANGGDWMPDYRLITPYFPLYAMVITISVVSIAEKSSRLKSRPVLVFMIMAFMNIYLIKLPLLETHGNKIYAAWREAWAGNPEDISSIFIGNTGKITVKDVMQQNEKIALEAGGKQAYILNQYYVIEINGLTDKALAKNKNPYIVMIPTFGKTNWIEVFKKDPEYLKFHSFGHLQDIHAIPSAKEYLKNYFLFQGYAPFETHTLLIKKTNENVPKFQNEYTCFEPELFIQNTLLKPGTMGAG